MSYFEVYFANFGKIFEIIKLSCCYFQLRVLLFLQFPLYFCMVRLFLCVTIAAATNTPTKSAAAVDAMISISVDDMCMPF